MAQGSSPIGSPAKGASALPTTGLNKNGVMAFKLGILSQALMVHGPLLILIPCPKEVTYTRLQQQIELATNP
jgi:hypothetical protein